MRRITHFTNCPCKSEFSQSPGRGASAPPPLLPQFHPWISGYFVNFPEFFMGTFITYMKRCSTNCYNKKINVIKPHLSSTSKLEKSHFRQTHWTSSISVFLSVSVSGSAWLSVESVLPESAGGSSRLSKQSDFISTMQKQGSFSRINRQYFDSCKPTVGKKFTSAQLFNYFTV